MWGGGGSSGAGAHPWGARGGGARVVEESKLIDDHPGPRSPARIQWSRSARPSASLSAASATRCIAPPPPFLPPPSSLLPPPSYPTRALAAARQLTPRERAQLAPPTPVRTALPRFFWMWTLKEVFAKARGAGLAFELRRIECDVHAANRGAPREDARNGGGGGRGRGGSGSECDGGRRAAMRVGIRAVRV